MDQTKGELTIRTFVKLAMKKVEAEFNHLIPTTKIDLTLVNADAETGYWGFHFDYPFVNNDYESDRSDGQWFFAGLYNPANEELYMEAETYGDWQLVYYNHMDCEKGYQGPEDGEKVPSRDRVVLFKVHRPKHNHKDIIITKEV